MEGESGYLTLLNEILTDGDFRQSRNGGVYSLFGKTLKFNLRDSFPLLTTKKMFFRGVIEELLFFLRGETNSKILEDKRINIWKGNTSKEFLESKGLNYQEGDMGPMYGFNWLHFGTPYEGCNANYEGRGLNQIEKVLDLLRNDPFSRRIIMTTYNPLCAEDGVLYPCHGIVTQFYVKEEGTMKYVSALTYLRSNDMFLGSPFNIASYAALVYIFCKILGEDEYKPDKLVMSIGDAHIYSEHVEQCMEQIKRMPYEFPKLRVNNESKDFGEWKIEDFELIEYNHHSAIQAEMKA